MQPKLQSAPQIPVTFVSALFQMWGLKALTIRETEFVHDPANDVKVMKCSA